MIEIAVETLKYVGPLILAIFRRGLEGKSQKEIAQALNRDETWVSRRVQKSVEHGLVEVEEEERWGWHYTYGTYAKWRANVIKLTEKGREVAKTLLYLDPVIEECPRCKGMIDVTGYSGIIRCPYCGYNFFVEGVEPPCSPAKVPWWIYLLFFFGGGFFGAILDGKNRWRGFGVGAAISTTLTALMDGAMTNKRKRRVTSA